MTIDELRSGFPRLYQQIFNAGVKAERRRLEAAELIVGSVESRNRHRSVLRGPHQQ
jgi:hypothetical protein